MPVEPTTAKYETPSLSKLQAFPFKKNLQHHSGDSTEDNEGTQALLGSTADNSGRAVGTGAAPVVGIGCWAAGLRAARGPDTDLGAAGSGLGLGDAGAVGGAVVVVSAAGLGWLRNGNNCLGVVDGGLGRVERGRSGESALWTSCFSGMCLFARIAVTTVGVISAIRASWYRRLLAGAVRGSKDFGSDLTNRAVGNGGSAAGNGISLGHLSSDGSLFRAVTAVTAVGGSLGGLGGGSLGLDSRDGADGNVQRESHSGDLANGATGDGWLAAGDVEVVISTEEAIVELGHLVDKLGTEVEKVTGTWVETVGTVESEALEVVLTLTEPALLETVLMVELDDFQVEVFLTDLDVDEASVLGVAEAVEISDLDVAEAVDISDLDVDEASVLGVAEVVEISDLDAEDDAMVVAVVEVEVVLGASWLKMRIS
ncbi:hypothetical protein VCV18_008015 [Metarhizium anisopliae]